LVAFSQSILVNNQSVNVSSEISFPYWLDSTSTLAIDSHVVSISVLEFNITPTVNGNSLIFNQAKTITSQETVPAGKTWKVESVLLDPSFVSTSNNNNGTTIVSGGGGTLRPVALSNKSSSAMTFGDAALYCDSLIEDGYDNWVTPTQTEILFVATGGGNIPGTRSSNFLWTSTFYENSSQDYHIVNISDFNHTYTYFDDNEYVRCVRHAVVNVSSAGGSSSGGSSTPSTLGNGMPTMISNESTYKMRFGNCVIYCDSLSELGFDDWIMPSLEQLTYAVSGGCVIPDSRTDKYIWSRTFSDDGVGNPSSAYAFLSILPVIGTGDNQIIKRTTANTLSFGSGSKDPVCRCVR